MFDMIDSMNDLRTPSSIGLPSNASPARASTAEGQSLHLDDLGQTEHTQGANSHVEMFSSSPIRHSLPPGETARSQEFASASIQVATSPARAGLLDVDTSVTASPSVRDPSVLSPSLCDPRSRSHADRSSDEMDFDQTQVGQDPLEGFLGYDPEMTADFMEFSSFHANFNTPAPNLIGGPPNVDDGLFLDNNSDNESLMDQFDSENNSAAAMAPWYNKNGGGKNEGNKYLNPSWKPQ